MARKVNAWMEHLIKFRAANKGMNNKLIFAAAKKTYKKQSGGMSELSPVPVSGINGTSGNQMRLALLHRPNLQINTTNYGGGSKKSKRRGSKRRGSKSRSCKRGGKWVYPQPHPIHPDFSRTL